MNEKTMDAIRKAYEPIEEARRVAAGRLFDLTGIVERAALEAIRRVEEAEKARSEKRIDDYQRAESERISASEERSDAEKELEAIKTNPVISELQYVNFRREVVNELHELVKNNKRVIADHLRAIFQAIEETENAVNYGNSLILQAYTQDLKPEALRNAGLRDRSDMTANELFSDYTLQRFYAFLKNNKLTEKILKS